MDEHERIFRNIISTMEVENLNVDNRTLNILNGYISNDLSEKQVIERIKNSFKNNM